MTLEPQGVVCKHCGLPVNPNLGYVRLCTPDARIYWHIPCYLATERSDYGNGKRE